MKLNYKVSDVDIWISPDMIINLKQWYICDLVNATFTTPITCNLHIYQILRDLIIKYKLKNVHNSHNQTNNLSIIPLMSL